jgi:hypothetical protein
MNSVAMLCQFCIVDLLVGDLVEAMTCKVCPARHSKLDSLPKFGSNSHIFNRVFS